MSKFFRQNDGGRDDRSGQCSATYFVDTGNSNDTRRAQFLFVTKSAAPVHPRKSSADLREVTSDM